MSSNVYVMGIDLSGPRNLADTHCAIFQERQASLHFLQALHGVDDQQIIDTVSKLGHPGSIVVGIDAPLSYNPGGGDRPSDAALRRLVQEQGGHVGIMPPTMIRMVYLTLRGIVLARQLESLKTGLDVRIVEVHPGAAMVLRKAPRADVAVVRRNLNARLRLLDWLETQGLKGILPPDGTPDHFVMACAASLAAWDWNRGSPKWCSPAQPTVHPYDFAC